MDESVITNNNYSPPFIKRIKEKLFSWIRLTNRPVVKIYHSYGGNGQIVVIGHVLKVSPLPRVKYRRNFWTNTMALIRLFIVKPIPRAKLSLTFNDETLEHVAEADGFFRFQWSPYKMPSAGWHKIQVVLAEGIVKKYYGTITGEGELFIPYVRQYAIISDIDDTFLISHSSNLRKRLYALLTQNAYTRKPFEGVVKHYQALAHAGTTHKEQNPFFYVSSSEWNLYDYIREFSKKNELPKGIYLLSQLKRLTEAWKTGQNRHGTKFFRIIRILEAFPSLDFILLGDDSQQDPVIYASVVEHFCDQIKAVYLRNVFAKNEKVVKEAIAKMESAGIPVCHFRHSAEAMEHSYSIGLIS
ncbi:MAG TPA: phosphatase domain-containing protein [Flavitalea sp.]|nr:phosphatase domain-containing protein [Flavitalea sp.]